MFPVTAAVGVHVLRRGEFRGYVFRVLGVVIMRLIFVLHRDGDGDVDVEAFRQQVVEQMLLSVPVIVPPPGCKIDVYEDEDWNDWYNWDKEG